MASEEAGDVWKQARHRLSQPEVVYLETKDSSEAIRERLRKAEGRQVLLVVPRGCAGLDGLVDLKLLGRQAIALDKRVALVTRDRKLKELAGELGLRTFSSVQRGQRAKWERLRPLAQDLFGASAQLGRSPGPMPAPAAAETLRLGEKILFGFVFVAMLALLGLILIVFVPAAEVTLRPVTYDVGTSLTIQANPELESLDYINLRIPARVVEMEVVGSDQLAATAMRDEPEATAAGQVVFTNKRSEVTKVISGTVVSTSTGTTIRFRTTEDATLGPQVGSRARARIEAIEPGPSGNVPAYSINRVEGLMDRQVNVINTKPTEGGALVQVTYVTTADKEQLREALLQRLKQQGYDSLVGGLSGEEFLPPESLVAFVLSETYDKFPGDAADFLGLHMRALVRGTVIDRNDVESLGLRMLQLEVREGFQLLSQEAEYQVRNVSEADYDGMLTLEVRAEGAAWVEIDDLAIREGIRGMAVGEAKEYLGRQLRLVEEPSVEISPAAWGRVPWLLFRISVHVLSEDTGLD